MLFTYLYTYNKADSYEEKEKKNDKSYFLVLNTKP